MVFFVGQACRAPEYCNLQIRISPTIPVNPPVPPPRARSDGRVLKCRIARARACADRLV
jgi:hypothetical protein